MKKNLIFSLFVLLAIFSALIYLPTPILQAQTPGTGFDISGWPWSDNVGFFSTDGLHVDASGVFSGYMWNDGIGWVNFAPSDGTPPSGTKGVRINNTAVTGWARACSVFVTGCSGTMKDDIYRGGWDGWVQMTSVDYNPTTGKFGGYAWGDLNVGWISFGVSTAIAGTCEATNSCDPGVDCQATNSCHSTGCNPEISVCSGDWGSNNVTLTIQPCQISATPPAVPDTLSISSADGKISNCTFGSGTCTDSTYLSEDTVTLEATYSGTNALGWTGCTPSPDNLSCSITLGATSPVPVSACPIQSNVGEITNIEIKTGQFGGIKFVKSSGSPYPASSLPFVITITGADNTGLSFNWGSAINQNGSQGIPANCQDIHLIDSATSCSASASSLDSVSSGSKYKLCFQSKCANPNNGNYSNYNGKWDVQFDATYADPDPEAPTGSTKTYNGSTVLDFTDSTHQ